MAETDTKVGGILKHKVGPFPAYVWVVLAGAVGYAIFKMSGGKKSGSPSGSRGQGTAFQSGQSTTTTDPTTGRQTTTTYNAQGDGYMPGMLTYGASPMPYSGGDVYVNVPASNNTSDGAPDVYNSAGENVGQYRFGSDQIHYLQQNLGKNHISPQIISDVQKAYAEIASSQSQGQADQYHYSWIGPSNVQAIPKYVNSIQDVKVNLP